MFPYKQFGSFSSIIYSKKLSSKNVVTSCHKEDSGALEVIVSSLSARETINSVLKAMAIKAQKLWPKWYGLDFSNLADKSPDQIESLLSAVFELNKKSPKYGWIHTVWLKEALEQIFFENPPFLSSYQAEIGARQLALITGHQIFSLYLVVDSEITSDEADIGFVKAVEWLSSETGLDIVVFIPDSLKNLEELSFLVYDAEFIENNYSVSSPMGTVIKKFPVILSDEKPSVSSRIIGKPHPGSPGEQAVASALKNDSLLKNMFCFNQQIKTDSGSFFIVDLLWPEGHLVVEIDGYSFHSDKVSFGLDRNRDYLLLLSGYLVLRLSHDEVMKDLAKSLEKIRSLVQFINENKNNKIN